MKGRGKAKAKAKGTSKAGAKKDSKYNGVTVVQKNMSSVGKAASGIQKKPAGRGAGQCLAGQLEAAAYHAGGLIHMNKCWEIVERIQCTGEAFVKSSDVLFVMKPMACAALETNIFKKLAQPSGVRTLRFHPFKDGTFDLRGLSALMKQYTPNVKTVSCWSLSAKNFELLDLDSVQEVTFMGCEFADPVFNLCLKNLKELVFQNTVPNPSALARSLLTCPRIERFFAHKFWADEIPSLYLPSCKDFTFRRGDCITKLHVYLPKAKRVNLDANYDLSDIKFLTRGKPEIKDFCPKPGGPQSRFRVSALNAFSGLRRGPEYLLSHPRVIQVIGLQDSDDDF